MQFGADGDRLTPADYDGDGKTDIAVYRPSAGTWFILKSGTGTVDCPVFGAAEDLPAPGDYDGARKADLTVFRPRTDLVSAEFVKWVFSGCSWGDGGCDNVATRRDGRMISEFRPSLGNVQHSFDKGVGVWGAVWQLATRSHLPTKVG